MFWHIPHIFDCPASCNKHFTTLPEGGLHTGLKVEHCVIGKCGFLSVWCSLNAGNDKTP